MSQRSNAKKNFIFNAIYQLSNIIVPLVTLPYLSRTLGAFGLGEYSFAYSVACYFSVFIRLGLANYGNRTIAYVKDDKDLLSKTFWEIYVFQGILGVFVLCIYLVYAFFFAPNRLLGILMALLVFSAVIDISWCMNGLEKFKITSIRDAITKVLTMVGVFLFVKEPDDVWKYTFIYALGMLINQIVILPVIKDEIKACKIDKQGIISHIKPNLILFIPVIAVSVYRTMDKIMLGIMTNDTELGYYHGAENVVRVPMAFVTALGTVMLPRMSNMVSNGESKKNLESTFGNSIMFAMFMASSICMGIMTVAKEFVPLFYGEGFDKCVYLFYIILPSCIFLAFANVIRTQYLLPRKKDMMYIISLIMGAVVNLVSNLVLIPYFESLGAAIGTLAAEVIVCVVQATFVFKEANIWRNILNSIPFVVAGIAMFVVCRGFNVGIDNAIIGLLIKIVISGAFYMTVLGILLGGRKIYNSLRANIL